MSGFHWLYNISMTKSILVKEIMYVDIAMGDNTYIIIFWDASCGTCVVAALCQHDNCIN